MNKVLGDSFHFEQAGLRLKKRAVLALAGGADLVAVGTAAIGNPDWMERVSCGLPLRRAPFTAAHLAELGFTPSALDYLASMGVLAPCDVA